MDCEHIQLAGVEPESIVDGPGFRYVLFVQGCPHGCPGCHNPQTHPFDGGYVKSVSELFDEIAANPILKGVTLSGGEPFCQAGALSTLAGRIKQKTRLDVIAYSGWTYEELMRKEQPEVHRLLALCDSLIDGRYIEHLRDLSLRFRGSSNQRWIDLNKTREQGKLILCE